MLTVDPSASNIHVVKWGYLGETWPYFRPNFVNMETARADFGAAKVNCPNKKFFCQAWTWFGANRLVYLIYTLVDGYLSQSCEFFNSLYEQKASHCQSEDKRSAACR